MSLRAWKPTVPRPGLLLLAGLMWSAVGLMLCLRAYGWLAAVPAGRALPLAGLGLVLGVAVYRFGFSRLARRNILRIQAAPDRACLFSFQAWRSYLIILVMITLGILLRGSPIPKDLLAPVYLTIGGGLFLSSLLYYVRLWEALVGKGA